MKNPESAGAKILIVDDVPANLNLLSDSLEPAGYNILAAPSGEVALKIARRALPDLILLDIVMPGMDGFETCRQLKRQEATRDIPVIFITARDESQNVVAGFEVGGVDYITKPFQPDEVSLRVATHLKIHRLTRELQQRNAELQAEIAKRHQAEADLQTADAQLSVISECEAERWGVSGFVGKSPAFLKVVQELRRLQNFSSTSVLLLGESGTGKELIARAIHFGSPLAKAPFVPVNCSAIPAELAESAFFGHLRGAFTGATADRKGYFEQAHKGALFLDEIGDMPLPLQPKLLRALEDGIIVPVGSMQEKRVEVRVLAGTHADLHADIAAGRFREDLFYRLARYTIEVPPLRERREDIPLLADHFLRLLGLEMGLGQSRLAPDALRALEQYNYPGNVRELRNLLERALIESGGGVIRLDHLQFARRWQPTASPGGALPTNTPAAPPNGPSAPAPDQQSDEDRILAYVRAHGSITNTECRELLQTGLQRSCYLLRKVYLAGLLKRSSTGRWSQYHLPDQAEQPPGHP